MPGTVPLILDPAQPPSELRRIAEISRPSKPDAWLTFFAYSDLLVVLSHSLWRNPTSRATEHLFSQLEYPLGVARWLVDRLAPVAGESLFVGDMNAQKKTIDGEEITLIHSSSGGGRDIPGYVLTNTDRRTQDSPPSRERHEGGEL